jgi:NAD-dependent deacetylase
MKKIKQTDFIVILTGAGISAESGIQTFRAADGLWENHRIDDVATPQGFKKNPELVWRFYKERYEKSLIAQPNKGHFALVEIEKIMNDNFFLVTQNVDGLHSRAGSKRVVEMHGRLNTCFCTNCKANYKLEDIDLSPKIPLCPLCNKKLRPDIVWFGETPYYTDQIYDAISQCTIFMTIGTSGSVYPAAYFISLATQNGAITLGVNLEEPLNKNDIDIFYQGKAGEILPKLIKKLFE